jgi:hypothetical protein
VVRHALDAGFIVNAPGPNTLRLAPPLIVTEAQLARFAAALPSIYEAAVSQQQAASSPATAAAQGTQPATAPSTAPQE